MKSTGIVRRIDDLGRIVIPKEMRKTLKINKNEPLEMFVDGEYLVLKKFNDYIDKGKLLEIIVNLADAVSMPVAVFSNGEILAYARTNENVLKALDIPKNVEVVKPFVKNDVHGFSEIIIAPCVTQFDTCIMIVVLSKDKRGLEQEKALAALTAKIISNL